MPKKLLDEIRKKENKTFLVSAHVHLEGDALGSELAMAQLLRALGKRAVVFNEDEVPEEYRFLPGAGGIKHALDERRFDAAVFVDCSDASRIGKKHKHVLKNAGVVLNIDHHISNARFGDVNWVEPRVSCTCEMVYALFKALAVPITRPVALLLYTGILADTGSFKYATTSAVTHQITGELLRHGLDVYQIHRRLYETMSVSSVRVLGRIIQGVKMSPDGKVAWLALDEALLRRWPQVAEQTDGIIHFARAIKGVEVALLFKETRRGQEVRVNFRSTGRVDVNRLARAFGGGGHKMASGATVKGILNNVVRRVTGEAQKWAQ